MPASLVPPPGAPPVGTEDGKLPGSVVGAAIMVIIVGGLELLVITAVILTGNGSSALWLNVLNYVVAAFLVALPIVMLMRKRWAYSLCVSMLAGTVVLTALQVILSGVLFQITAIPIIVFAVAVVALLYGLPLMLLMGKKARQAFEDPHKLSAVVWAGGGWEYPGSEPFAYHPSEMPPPLVWSWMPPMPPPYGYPPVSPAYAPGAAGWPGNVQVPYYPQYPQYPY